MRPIFDAVFSVNHRAPSGPVVTKKGLLLSVGVGNRVTVPEVVIRPIFDVMLSVNQRAPSGPLVMSFGKAEGVGNSVYLCAAAGVTIITPIPNQRAMNKTHRSVLIASSKRSKDTVFWFQQNTPVPAADRLR